MIKNFNLLEQKKQSFDWHYSNQEQCENYLKSIGFEPFEFEIDNDEHKKYYFFHPMGFITRITYYNGHVDGGLLYYIAAKKTNTRNYDRNFYSLPGSGGYFSTKLGLSCISKSYQFGGNNGNMEDVIYNIFSSSFLLSQVPSEGLQDIKLVYPKNNIEPIVEAIRKLPKNLFDYLNGEKYINSIQNEYKKTSIFVNKENNKKTWLHSISDELNDFYKNLEASKKKNKI